MNIEQLKGFFKKYPNAKLYKVGEKYFAESHLHLAKNECSKMKINEEPQLITASNYLEESVTDEEPVAPVAPATKGPVVPVTKETKEPVAPVAPASKEPVVPVTKETKEPVAPVAPASKEPVAPVTKETKEPIAPVAPAIEEPVAPVAPIEDSKK